MKAGASFGGEELRPTSKGQNSPGHAEAAIIRSID
jgi:hypothetical protein